MHFGVYVYDWFAMYMSCFGCVVFSIKLLFLDTVTTTAGARYACAGAARTVDEDRMACSRLVDAITMYTRCGRSRTCLLRQARGASVVVPM